MKEWANKPSALLTTSSSPVKLTAGSAIVKTSSSPMTLTSGVSSQSLVQAASKPIALTAGTSTVASSSSGAASVGTELGRVATGVATVAPLAGGVAVAGVGAVFYAVSNMIKYGKSEKTGLKATRDTVVSSAGLGLSAGLGIAVAHAVAGTALALGTAVVVPLAAGVAVTCAGVKLRNKIFFKQNAKAQDKSKRK